jgi:glycosyltransferase involved in cell wall biosynthesis
MKMRICFLADGRSYHTQRWVDYFAQKGHLCSLISLEQGIKTQAVHYILKSYTPIAALNFILVVPQVKKILKDLSPDILNAHFASAYGFTGALTRFRPLVVSCWGSDILISPKKSFAHKMRVKYVLKKADLLTCDGRDLSNAVKQLGPKKENIIVSPMGIDQGMLQGSEDRKSPKKELVVLSTRKLESVYDLKTLLLAASEVKKTCQEKVKFLITGEGSQKERLVRLSSELRMDDTIEFTGFLRRKSFLDIFKKADLYVSTSVSDSTSVALLEAMALGLIPVVTDIPGNREWIKDGENGFLFPPKDHQTLAEKLMLAIRNFHELDNVRKKNLLLIKKRALWEDNMGKIEDRFLELIKEKKLCPKRKF